MKKPRPTHPGNLTDPALAAKRALAAGLEEAMRDQGVSKSAMARRMGTSRPALDRLLDPDNTSVTLHTMQRAAASLGKKVRLDLIEAQRGR